MRKRPASALRQRSGSRQGFSSPTTMAAFTRASRASREFFRRPSHDQPDLPLLDPLLCRSGPDSGRRNGARWHGENWRWRRSIPVPVDQARCLLRPRHRARDYPALFCTLHPVDDALCIWREGPTPANTNPRVIGLFCAALQGWCLVLSIGGSLRRSTFRLSQFLQKTVRVGFTGLSKECVDAGRVNAGHPSLFVDQIE